MTKSNIHKALGAAALLGMVLLTGCQDVSTDLRQCSHETEAHKKMHLICIAARNDAVFFAYLVATPLHRFKCKKAFSTR